MNKDVFDEMGKQWLSAIVARTEVERFSGGLLSSKYMANLDSLGRGPARVVIGRKVCYPVRELVAWLRERAK